MTAEDAEGAEVMRWRVAQPIWVPPEIDGLYTAAWTWKGLKVYGRKTAGELGWVLEQVAGISVGSVRRALRRLGKMGLIVHSRRREPTAKGGWAWKWSLVKRQDSACGSTCR